MNYDQATEYLEQIYTRGSHPGLSRVLELLEILGSPQNRLKIIHVAGTNGKGSVCTMLEQILCAEGLKTGLFTSPSITRVNECYRICGKPISDTDFARLIDSVKSAENFMQNKPTGFEFETAAALKLFVDSKCDIVILETGMGGELDATNVCDSSLVSVITDIGMDHESYLGSTIRDIASHKAGIIKPNCPIVFGGTDRDAMQIVYNRAKDLNAPITIAERNMIKNIRYSLSGTEFESSILGYNNIKFSLPLLGIYQPKNCAIVLKTVEVLKKYGLDISLNSITHGIRNTVWHGRFEILRHKPLIIYDGAHNPHGMNMCVQSIKQYFGHSKVNVIMGVMSDKNYNDMLDILCPCVSTAYAVTPNNPRALYSSELAEKFIQKGVNALSFDTIDEGIKRAVANSTLNSMPLLIIGTLYMYKDIMTELI